MLMVGLGMMTETTKQGEESIYSYNENQRIWIAMVIVISYMLLYNKAVGAKSEPFKRIRTQERLFKFSETLIDSLCLILWKGQPSHLSHEPERCKVKSVTGIAMWQNENHNGRHQCSNNISKSARN